MTKITSAALFFLAAGIFTSVTILSAYQILFAIPLTYYLYLAVKNKDFKLPKSAWFLLAFMAVALLSLVINYDLLPKPSKNFGRLKYLLYGFGGIFVFKAWVKDSSEKTKSYLINFFLFSVALAGAFATIKFFHLDMARARGFTGTLRYGYGSSMALILILGLVLHQKRFQHLFDLKLAITALVFGLIGFYFTYTRGALLAFLCAFPILLYFYKPKLGLTLGGLGALAVLALVLNYLFGSTQYNSRFLVNKNNPSDHIRRSQWKAALIATQEKPVLGWGYSNFHSQLKRIKEQYDLDAKHYNDAHSHNLFLEVASGTGLIGLLLFLGWVISWAWESFKSGGLTRAMIIPFGAAFVVGSQFEMTFDANNASLVFFIYALSSYLTLDGKETV